MADVNAGILGALGVLAAYNPRAKPAAPARGDLAAAGGVPAAVLYAALFLLGRHAAGPAGTAHPIIAPYQTFHVADGELAIGGATESNWQRVAQVLGQPQWRDDPRFHTAAARIQHRAELTPA